GFDANQTVGGIADVECAVQRREGDAAVEAAERGDGFDLPRSVDPIDLTRLAAGPELAGAIKGEALRVIEPGGENLEAIDGNFRVPHPDSIGERRGVSPPVSVSPAGWRRAARPQKGAPGERGVARPGAGSALGVPAYGVGPGCW